MITRKFNGKFELDDKTVAERLNEYLSGDTFPVCRLGFHVLGCSGASLREWVKKLEKDGEVELLIGAGNKPLFKFKSDARKVAKFIINYRNEHPERFKPEGHSDSKDGKRIDRPWHADKMDNGDLFTPALIPQLTEADVERIADHRIAVALKSLLNDLT